MEKAEEARSKHRTEEAISHFNKAVSIDPEFVAARNNLGSLFLSLDRPQEGVAQLEEAAKTDPHQPALFNNLSVGYDMMNNFEASERAARTLLSLDGTWTRGPLLLGCALVKQRKFTEETLQCLERAHDKYPLAYLLTAQVLEAKGELEKVKSELRAYLNTGEQRLRGFANLWLKRISPGEQEAVVLRPR